MESIETLTRLLTEIILPNLRSVQTSQASQIAANERIEQAIADLRTHLDSQFSQLFSQLTACRAEMAATQAMIKAVRVQKSGTDPSHTVH